MDDTSGSSAGQPVGHHRSIEARALWTGGVAAGLVAALVAVAGLVIARTPQPFTFFGWIMAVAIVLAAAEPFTSDARLAAKVATAAINVVIGLAISTLVTGSARRSIVLRHYC